MTLRAAEVSAHLPCHVCGYDLRAHPQDGKCPECEASIAESRRLATLPLRPAWRDSDPRWRRRMLAGAWLLVLIPLMQASEKFDWASNVRAPNVFNFPGRVQTLDNTLFTYTGVYEPLIFCMGIVLLFSKERNRRRNRFDRARGWGVLCSYVTLLLSAVQILFIGALILAGIAGVFLSMPKKYEPGVTKWFVDLSSGYLRYGAYAGTRVDAVLAAFSSITVLLACIALFDALRSSGPKRIAAYLLAPLVLFALLNLGRIVQFELGFGSVAANDVYSYRSYFRSDLLMGGNYHDSSTLVNPGFAWQPFGVELTKWGVVLTIAIWLTIAQFLAWRGARQN